eukprot:5800541-Pyramimonas_sp.AAC.1
MPPLRRSSSTELQEKLLVSPKTKVTPTSAHGSRLANMMRSLSGPSEWGYSMSQDTGAPEKRAANGSKHSPRVLAGWSVASPGQRRPD